MVQVLDRNGTDVTERYAQETEPASEPEPCPGPPEFLSFEAQCEWLRSAPGLHSKGRLHGGMVALLENYCITVGLAREMNQIIEIDGKFVGGRAHPAIKIMQEAVRDARALAAQIDFEKDLEQAPSAEVKAALERIEQEKLGANAWAKEQDLLP